MKPNDQLESNKIAVVIPCYKVSKHILSVIETIPKFVASIYVIDDCCPEKSGNLVEQRNRDSRVRVIRNEKNLGVGGAVMNGLTAAIDDGADVIVKIDGDGQMDPEIMGAFVEPILNGRADYTKGNRFYDLDRIRQMPWLRIFGNAGLSFITKISSGYWHVFDPTNGYTAIHARVAENLPLHKISKRYFFESDMLFRLGCLRASVVDIPMHAKYEQETSNLIISRILGDFSKGHFKNACKRIIYNYYLRDLTVASFELLIGLGLLIFGVSFGLQAWHHSVEGAFASSGTVMLAALPTILGIQFLLAFVSYDMSFQPKDALWMKLKFKSFK